MQRALQPGAPKVGPAERGATQACLSKIGLLQIGVPQVGVNQSRTG